MDLSEKALEEVVIEIDKFSTEKGLTLIRTAPGPKALWPGLKAWFDDAYKAEYISTPILIDVEEAFDSDEEAEDCCDFIRDLVASLQLKVALDIKQLPVVTRIDYKWYVNANFTIHKPIEDYKGDPIESDETIPSSTAI